MHKNLDQNNSILPLYKIFETKDHIILMLEYEEGGDLVKLIENRQKLSEYDTMTIME